MNIISIYLVEDDPKACNRFVADTKSYKSLNIIGITNNADKALIDIYDLLPDVLILDLELHQGGGNGLNVLQILCSQAPLKKPYIIITTNNSSASTLEFARKLGADFIFSKHQKNYSERSVLDFIVMLQPIIAINCSEPNDLKIESRKRDYLSQELIKLGIHPKNIGYSYLIDAILMVSNGESTNLCSKIGEQSGKSESSVERAMQNAIKRAWKNTDIDVLLNMYTAPIRAEKGVPTLTEFIYFFAEKLRTKF